ncbi:hypothetical protein [Salinactinospora qingdaonensis]|uniref:Uncharacterized protein n=1 Tax=Salinactinospora qingdaonensis TaxID=702744 RepID=A0ABP7FA26_9ACTN
MHTFRPLANGLRTDHPVPDLPFIDDTHLPLEDPEGLEAVGRGAGEGMWGRWDPHDEGWLAFTTDPFRHDLGWCVRYHPDHGRSVLLYRDEDASSVHMDWWGDPLLFRSGGYWWDGSTWYRPGQVWDAAAEDFERRTVPAAVNVTAADLLDDSADPDHGHLLKVANFSPEVAPPDRWADELALWARYRSERGEQRPLDACVVTLSAPELAGDQLVGITEMAQLGGIAASTLRAYISRGEGDVPPPQATVNGRSMWARPVAKEWGEQRHRSPESVAASLTSPDDNYEMPVGQAQLRRRLAKTFMSVLWNNPARRKRWTLRHRTEAAVSQVADELAWSAAADLDRIVPTADLQMTVKYALLRELAAGRGNVSYHGINRSVARMLDWLIRHHPDRAQHTIGGLVGQAERELGIDRKVTARSLRTALAMDGKLEQELREDFLDRVLPRTT